MKWLVVIAFVVFVAGLCIVVTEAALHSRNSIHNKPIKPVR